MEETLCVASSKYTLECLRIDGLQQVYIQYNISWVISSRAVNSDIQIVKFMLQR